MLKIKGSFQKIFANQKIALFIGSLDKFFIKLPHLPKKVRLFISRVVPFLALAFGIVGLLAAIISGLFLVLTIMTGDVKELLAGIGSFIIILLDTLFLIKAFKPLKNGNAVGWIYLFWAEMLEIVNFVIRIVNQESNIWMDTLIIVLSFYLLFEIGQFYVYQKDPTKN
jgi:hypothetical protein